MYVFKCKMCGGNLEVKLGETVCECEYCGTKQTVPAADNEKKMKQCTWWLRTPGSDLFHTMVYQVETNGISTYGRRNNSLLYGIRPAIWFELGPKD